MHVRQIPRASFRHNPELEEWTSTQQRIIAIHVIPTHLYSTQLGSQHGSLPSPYPPSQCMPIDTLHTVSEDMK